MICNLCYILGMDQLHTPTLFTTSQVADILGVTRITIFRWIKEGTIAAKKVGRNYLITHDELLKHVEKRPLTEAEKVEIKSLVERAVTDYGETIRMLGRE